MADLQNCTSYSDKGEGLWHRKEVYFLSDSSAAAFSCVAATAACTAAVTPTLWDLEAANIAALVVESVEQLFTYLYVVGERAPSL